MKIPYSTYRLQFNSGFRLTDASLIVDYLHELGIDTVYSSPLMKARCGSIHGYDVTDPNTFNPEIGSRQEFEHLVDQLHERGMGILLDIVPNHMAASLENPWWVDILARGESSSYAHFLDIDWTTHKVFLPILAKPYGECLEAGEIKIRHDNGHSALQVSSLELPVQVSQTERIETADDLDRVVSAQPYRLGYWRKAADSINYRRFFDINDLVAIRTEHEEVFEATHRTILHLVATGLIDGLRIDHIDGLLDPKVYLDRLPDTYVVVEKILGAHELIPGEWKTQGTTGYDFLNALNAVLIDAEGYRHLERTYNEFTGTHSSRLEVFRARKRQVIEELFTAELRSLVQRLTGLAQSHRRARDLTLSEIREVLVAVTSCLPVYRTYIRDFTISDSDRGYIEQAINAASPNGALDFLREVLFLQPPQYLTDHRRDYLNFVMHWQQFTGPVMAKGLEDTTFYAHNPLLSVNEVGNDCSGPEGLLGIDTFHRQNVLRLQRQPFSMNTSSTHDTKRGEDARTRIDVLCEFAEEWKGCLKQWSEWNPSESAPDRNEQIFIYQTLLGAWPVSRSRFRTYLIKALREAKTNTTWLHPDEQYEQRVLDFVDGILDPARSHKFLTHFLGFHKKISYFGAINSLSQTLLKIMSPGLTDFYQGTELWDFSLADPDNRHPINFEIRKAWLDWVKTRGNPKTLLDTWQDGRIKMFLVWKALSFRRDNIDLFLHGDYIPLETTGRHASNVIAFARRNDARWAVVVTPRLSSQLTSVGKPPVGEAIWADTRVCLPPASPREFQDIFTGNRVNSPYVSKILSDLPFSLFQSVEKIDISR